MTGKENQMKDHEKTKEQLIAEVAELRQRVSALEAVEKAVRSEANEQLRCEVDERRRAEQALTVFRWFADAAVQGFGMTDLDGRITYVNPIACRLIGARDPSDAIGKDFTSYYPEEFRTTLRSDIIPTILRRGRWSGEVVVPRATAGWTTTLDTGFLVRDDKGTPIGLAVTATDITAQKQAEEALRESRDQLQAVYDGMMDGLTVVDMETGAVVRANAALCEVLGFSEQEMMARTPEQRHPPEAMPRLREHFEAKVQGTETRFVEMPCSTSDGRVRYFDTNATRIVYRGRPSFLLFMHDVTERRRAQEALRQSHEELETVYDGMVEGLAIIFSDTKRIIRVNASLCRMLGFTEEELLSLSITEIHPADDTTATLRRIQTRIERQV